MTTPIGGTITLPCRTTSKIPVDWVYSPSENDKAKFICAAGNFLNGYSERMTLDRSVHGDYSLTIVNVSREDAGVYICTENAGLGPEHRIQLSIQGKLC